MIDSYLIEDYIEQHASPMDEVLYELYRETHLHVMNPRMASGPVQGRFLQILCQMMRPRRVLEIGTFTGFSAICIARGLPDEGILTTIEANEEYEDMIRRYLEKANVSHKVNLIMGDAKQVIPALKETFDMVFIDADKVSYPIYYNMVVDKINPGGILLADNVLWEGKVAVTSKEKDTRAIQTFNDLVQSDPRLENVLLPIRDGLMMARKRDI